MTRGDLPNSRVVAISGGFDPLHGGHLALMKEAASYGKLAVILNTDDWLLRKKGFVFLPWKERADIIEALSFVWRVIPALDHDNTVCENLKLLQPAYFANGGDRGRKNTPEQAVCKELGVKMLWGIGGNSKQNSSSEIAKKPCVSRAWGKYEILTEGAGHKVKRLTVNPQSQISLQTHEHRGEHWVVVSGHCRVQKGEDQGHLKKNSHIYIAPREKHQIINPYNFPCEIIEVQTGTYFGEDDITRY